MINRPEYDMKLIGRNLKRLRKAKRFTVEEVRRYLGLGSVQAVYKYEAGKSYPPADTLFALMQLYEADLYDIVCGCDRTPMIAPVDEMPGKQFKRLRGYWGYYTDYMDRKAG